MDRSNLPDGGISRRRFVATGSLLPFISIFGAPGLYAARAAADLVYSLFMDEASLGPIRALYSGDPLFGELRKSIEEIDRDGERRFLAEEIRYNDHLYDIGRLGRVAPQLAFHYLMTGDEDAAALATELIQSLMRFPKWDYFLENGEQVVGIQRASSSTVAVSLCADWLGDRVSADERAEWMETMGDRGCEACFLSVYGMRHPERVQGWSMDETSTYFEHRPGDRIDLSNWPYILDKTNLKAVPASALAIGAVAYERQFGRTERTDRWIEQAAYSIGTFRDLYERDGSYNENISYANYTTEHIVQGIEVLKRFRGLDLFDALNWSGFIDFVQEMSMPTTADPYAIVNFGDAGNGMLSAVPFWIASRAHDGRASWFGRELTRGHDIWSLLWYNPDSPVEQPDSTPHVWRSDLDWIVARTGYTPDDLVVAMRSGGPSNHEHADRGSIIVKCYGEQLVADPYRPPYSFSDPAWIMRTTKGHSALLIDGEGHQYHDGSEGTNPSDAVARIVRQTERDGYCMWTSDATPAYALVNSDIESVTRTVVAVYAQRAVVVLDKVIKKDVPSRLQARFFAYNMDEAATIKTDDAGFQIHRPTASVYGTALSRQKVLCEKKALDIPEETARLHPFVDAATVAADKQPLLITVLTPTRTTVPGAAVIATETDYGFDIRVGLGNIRVFDTGSIPEIAVTV